MHLEEGNGGIKEVYVETVGEGMKFVVVLEPE